MTASTRRAALGAILAAPLASVPAMAASNTVSGDEARFLALAPRIVSMLDEMDRVWAIARPLYEKWNAAREALYGRSWRDHEDLPEWHDYVSARQPADDLDEALDDLYAPFMNVRFVSFDAILLRHRIGMTLEHFDDDAKDDMTALWEARRCV